MEAILTTLEEAENYILNRADDIELGLDGEGYDINKEIENEIKNLDEGKVIAFVDGSYSPDIDGREKYGFGAILFTKGHEQKLFKAYVNQEYMDSRNVAGELSGVKQSILWAIENNKKEIQFIMIMKELKNGQKKSGKRIRKLQRNILNLLTKNLN